MNNLTFNAAEGVNDVNLEELNERELSQVNGAFAVPIALFAIGFAYNYGRDMAARENAMDQKRRRRR